MSTANPDERWFRVLDMRTPIAAYWTVVVSTPDPYGAVHVPICGRWGKEGREGFIRNAKARAVKDVRDEYVRRRATAATETVEGKP